MDDKDINVDPLVLKNKRDSSLSLTDKNNIQLFTDEVQESFKREYKNKEREKKEKKGILFTGKLNANNTSYLDKKESLFLEDRKVIINKSGDEFMMKGSYIFSGFIIVLFILGMLFYFKLRRRRLDDISIDHYNE